jgi:hypothetical protein
MLVVELKGLRFHLGYWGMGRHLATDRIHEQLVVYSRAAEN